MNKLTYIANARMPTEKAHGIQIMKMCEAFADQGANVELIIPRRFNYIEEDPFSYYGVEKNFTITQLPTIDLMPVSSGWFKWLAYWVNYLVFSELVFWYTLFNAADVYYSRNELPLLYLSLRGSKTYWETHQAHTSVITKLLLQFVDGIVAISRGLEEYFCERGLASNSVITAFDGVNLSDFDNESSQEDLRERLHMPQDREIISYIGRYQSAGDKKKGVDEIIAKFPDIKEVCPQAFLLIVGVDPENKNDLESKIEQHGVSSEDFQVVEFVSHQKALWYMQASDILVMNYPDTEHHRKYMSPLKLAEYMGSGTPIVTSDLPAIRWVLCDDCGYFFDPGDMDDFRDGIIQILKNDKYAKTLSENARQEAKEHTWNGRAKKIISFMGKK